MKRDTFQKIGKDTMVVRSSWFKVEKRAFLPFFFLEMVISFYIIRNEKGIFLSGVSKKDGVYKKRVTDSSKKQV